jgi:23S rRNA (adenine2503-C2)-methyltransferase
MINVVPHAWSGTVPPFCAEGGSAPLPEENGETRHLEWVLLRGVNSGPEDAKALARFVKGLSVVVNVIPWNGVPGLPFEEPDREEVDDFVRRIGEAGMTVTRRYRRGRGINGACGQLAT